MTQSIPGPGFPAQRRADNLERRNQQPAAPDNTIHTERRPSPNGATPSSVFPANIPVLRWARSGVSIVQFLEDEIDNSEWEADEPDGVRNETAFQ